MHLCLVLDKEAGGKGIFDGMHLAQSHTTTHQIRPLLRSGTLKLHPCLTLETVIPPGDIGWAKLDECL